MTTEEPLARIEGEASASLDGLDVVHALLTEYWIVAEAALTQPVDAMWRALFDTAVGEIAGNIVRHAYPPAAPTATFQLVVTCYLDRMEAMMLDQGTPYVLMPAVGKPDMRDALDNIDLDHGWGLPIAHAAADGLEYTRLPDGRNRWLITKRLSA